MTGAASDFDWRAQIEVKVLRFLLSRYPKATALPLAPTEIVEGQTPYGRSRTLLSKTQQRGRLDHIAQSGQDCPPEVPPIWDFGWKKRLEQSLEAERGTIRRREIESRARRERYATRRNRGYW
jgi:hypothetical protein